MRWSQSQPRSPDPRHDELEIELVSLSRRYRGLIDLARVERLCTTLAASSVAVLRSTSGFCGDRVVLVLEDGSALRLHLFWPERQAFARLESLVWRDDLGWVVSGTSVSGEPLRCYAWKAAMTLPITA